MSSEILILECSFHGDLGLPVRKILKRIAKSRRTRPTPCPSRSSSGPVIKSPSLSALIRPLSKRSTLGRADDPQSPSCTGIVAVSLSESLSGKSVGSSSCMHTIAAKLEYLIERFTFL